MNEITFRKVETLGKPVIHCFICAQPVKPKVEKVSMIPTTNPTTGEDWLIFFHEVCAKTPEGEEFLNKLKKQQAGVKKPHSQ